MTGAAAARAQAVTRTAARAAAHRLAAAAVLVVAVASAGCGREPAWTVRDGAPVTFQVVVRETLLPPKVWHEVSIAGEGTWTAGAADLRILSVTHSRQGGSGPVVVVSTLDTAASVSERSAADAAVAQVAESLVGRTVRLAFDPLDGLREVAGMDPALDVAASDPLTAEARDGLRPLVSDAALRRALRGAGMAPVPEDFRDRAAVLERFVDTYVSGRGVASVRMLGQAGVETDGSPVVRLSGRLADDASFSGPPGVTPPDEVGPVRVGRVEAEAETLFDLDTARPLRGTVTVRTPYASGATVVTRTSFLLSVRP